MFLTPYYNRRDDEYNGEIHDRARIIYEVYEEVRSRVGKDFAVMIKLNFDDFMDEGEGLVFEDAIEVFKRLDELGIDRDKITMEATFEEDLEVDSLGVVELLMALEDSFGISIPDEDAEEITTVGEAIDMVAGMLGG